MLEDIKPGSQVHIKIIKRPTNAAAKKTLQRVLNKDIEVRREHRRLEDVRRAGRRTHQRGGRPWSVRVPKQYPVHGEIGESGTVLASVDVLRDLGSVHRFVEVTPAAA